MCLKCNEVLSSIQLNGVKSTYQYREYALLGRGKNFKIREDFADSYIATQVEQLFDQRKLVLVLDLDNTLIHTREVGCDKRIKGTKVELQDELFDQYITEMAPWRYLVKCRPYLNEFMEHLLPKYQVFFYTAGIRSYGLMIMEVIKANLLRGLEGRQEEK
jgi:RNA polymerase II subunit A-like phosphatase